MGHSPFVPSNPRSVFHRSLRVAGALILGVALAYCGEPTASKAKPAAKLVFTAQPTTATAGAAINPAVVVTALTADDDLASDFEGNVTMSITVGTGTAGATLSGTVTVAANNGVATFSDLRVNRSGTGYALSASSSGLTLVSPSSTFDINPGAASKVRFTVQPTGAVAGSAITPSVVVTAQDANDNTATTFNGAITLAIGTNPGAGTLGGTVTVGAVSGVATFAGLSIDKSGNGYTLRATSGALSQDISAPFNIASGVAASLAFAVQPSTTAAGAAIAPTVQVTALDAQGNVATGFAGSVTLGFGSNPGGGALTGATSTATAGVASFPSLSIDKVGTGYTLTAAATGLTGVTSSAFNITAGTATQLAFTVQPSNVAAGASIAPAVQVQVRDANGNLVTTSTASITMAIGTNPGSSTLGGTTSVNAVGGVATFSALNLNKVGTGYTLTASGTGLTSATSAAFNVSAGGAATIAISAGNGQTAQVGTAVAIDPAVLVTDVGGNPVSGVSVTFAVATGGGSVTGASQTTNASGIATATSWTLGAIAGSNTLTATSAGLTGSPVTFTATATAGSAARLAFGTQPSNVAAGASIAPAVTVRVEDAAGNLITGSTASITLAIGANPGTSVLGGTVTANAVGGIATFSNLSLNKSGTGYTLTAASLPLTGATSAAFNVTAGAAANIAISAGNSQSATVGTAVAVDPAVLVTDANANPVSGVSVTFAVATGGGSVTGGSQTTNASGIATVTSWTLGTTAGANTLTATSAGLTGSPVTFTATGTAGAATHLGFGTQPSNIQAAGTISPAVTVQLLDANNNLTTSTANVTVAIGTNPSGGTLSGTTTVAAVAGVATFSTLSINSVGVGYTLAASSAGLTGATSAAFNVSAGSATQVAFVQQPSSVTAGATMSPAVTVEVQDAGGNIVSTSTAAVTLAIGTNPGGSTLGGTVTVNAVAGVATFSTLTLNKSGTGYTLAASAGGLSGDVSSSFNVAAGAATTIAISAGDGQTAAAGSAVAVDPAVLVTDANANPVSGVSVTFAVAGGGGSVTGGSATTDGSGIATVGSWTLGTTAGANSLTATSAGLTGSPLTFNATGTAGAATKVVFGQQPSNATSGASITPAVTVQIQDANNNVVTTSTATVTIAIGTNPGSGTLGGTTSVPAIAGVATFSDLAINAAGTGYTLTAASTGLTGATSGTFDITAGAATQLAFGVQPSNVTAGASITPAVTVEVRDAGGNVVTGSTASVTLAFGTNPGGSTLGGTVTVNAVAGVATFSNLSVNKVGAGYTLAASSAGLTGATSGTFDVAAGAAANIAISAGDGQSATVNTAVAIAPAVLVTDANANPVSGVNVTFAVASGGGAVVPVTAIATNASGIATVTSWTLGTTAGANTLSATSAGLTGSPVTFNATGTAGAATKVAFAQQPTTAGSGAAISPPVTVQVQDAFSNLVTTSSATVTVAIGTNPAGGTLAGTTSVAASGGVATFSTLNINNVGTGYTLTAASTGLTGATSSTFNITPGAPTKVVFVQQPTNTVAGQGITPALTVQIQDANNNVVTTSTANVTIAIGTNPGGGTLSGTVTVAAVAGVATFPGLSINRSGTGYTLTAASAGLTGATSNAFNITAAAASVLVFTTQPVATAAGSAITPAVVVTAQDGLGNNASFTGNVTVAIGTNPAAGTLSGTLTVPAVAGVATFSTLSINRSGTGYTLTASATGLAQGTSASFNIVAGAVTQLVFLSQPGNSTIARALAPSFQVAAQDALGNTNTSYATAITMSIFTNPNSGVLSGTVSATTGNGKLANGVATFNDLRIDKGGAGYVLRATSGAIVANTAAFDMFGMYVVNFDGATIGMFPAEASGDVAPTSTIEGPSTAINAAVGAALDASGTLYVTSFDQSKVTVYAAGVEGDAAPIRTISGANTGLSSPVGAAVDAAGNLYVVNEAAASVTVYAPGADGNATPIRTITGLNTLLDSPSFLALDATDTLYVVNQGGRILTFAPNADGDAVPVRFIGGTNTLLAVPEGIGLDASRNIYVANKDANGLNVGSIAVFAAGSDGDVAPIRVIEGGNTSLAGPLGMTVFGSNIYVANYANGSVLVFPTSATGNVNPTQLLIGGNTGLNGPFAIAF